MIVVGFPALCLYKFDSCYYPGHGTSSNEDAELCKKNSAKTVANKMNDDVSANDSTTIDEIDSPKEELFKDDLHLISTQNFEKMLRSKRGSFISCLYLIIFTRTNFGMT